jgi:hypothetical protein
MNRDIEIMNNRNKENISGPITKFNFNFQAIRVDITTSQQTNISCACDGACVPSSLKPSTQINKPLNKPISVTVLIVL